MQIGKGLTTKFFFFRSNYYRYFNYRRILSTTSTDHFYTLMGTLCEKLTQMRQMEINNFMSVSYRCRKNSFE